MANAKMRQTLEQGGMVVAPGAYDTPTARLMEHLGFDYLYVGGSQTGTVLGTTEPLTTVTQMADVGRTVARACREEMPVILDAGAGFGDPVHVMYAVEALEAAGVTAIHIEDQFFPKRVSYHRGLEHVVPMDVYQQRLEHAVKARKSKDFLIIGRNDGFHAVADPWIPEGGGREEAVKRAHAAMEVGVDAIMVIGVREKEDFQYFRSQIKDIPLVALAGSSALGVPDFQAAGHQIVIYPGSTIQSSLRAIYDVYEYLMRTGTLPEEIGDTRELMTLGHTLARMSEKWAVEEEIGHNV